LIFFQEQYKIRTDKFKNTQEVIMKRIVLTGGGTAGHVTPNLALLPRLKELGYDIHYIGSYNGIEKKLIEQYSIPYYGISSGKLRRYFDWKNFSDPFKVIKGYGQARTLLKKLKPDVVFSKGGFVSVPVILAAKHRKIPAIIHESDITPGLANKLAIPNACKVCCNFPETLKYLPADKAVLTGSPIREELLSGNRLKGLTYCGFQSEKPVIMVIGGSTGSQFINKIVRSLLPDLLKDFQVLHLCGKGKLDSSFEHTKGYAQFEYANKELSDMFALADLVISRAGANAICELLALRKPNILIPLSANASRGDQILNARSFEGQGYSVVIEEEQLNSVILLDAIKKLFQNRNQYINAMAKSEQLNSVETIVQLLEQAANQKK
jgi:UDP-N-acetylglucosamine--N-acetylmuramyl-(pentapeptide) pyrophosphoryl-undecaprenol N-acetylglucosamine transferase